MDSRSTYYRKTSSNRTNMSHNLPKHVRQSLFNPIYPKLPILTKVGGESADIRGVEATSLINHPAPC